MIEIEDSLIQYIESMVPNRSPLLLRMEEEAAREYIPIIQLPSIQLIRILLQLHRPRRILEIGTAIGYSTIWLASAAPDAQILSLEISEEKVERARENLAEAGLSDRVTVLHQDACEGIAVDEPFDMVFIDAAKGQYMKFFNNFVPHLRTGGLLICDNVLLHGMVIDEQVPRRKRTMTNRLRVFNRFLADHPALDTAFVPIGDGLALCIKREGI